MAWGMKIQIGISWSRGSISPRIEDETMVNILPFQRTSQLIREIDEFIDKVSEAQMVLEQALLHYFEVGADEGLNQKLAQIGKIEERADELRRNVANMMFSQMLMPDTRGDVLELLGQVDVTLDDCVHIMVDLAIERPTPSGQHVDDFKTMIAEVGKAVQAMLRAARAYFKEPHAVRDHVHKINFHDKEATKIALRVGRAAFDSDLSLSRKRQVRDWLAKIRGIASHANDIGDHLSIFAVKRSV